LLGPLPESLAILRAIDAAEADAFRMIVMQDFDGVAVEDRDDGAGKRVSVNNARKRKCVQHQK
jgi:hypothetical protein